MTLCVEVVELLPCHFLKSIEKRNHFHMEQTFSQNVELKSAVNNFTTEIFVTDNTQKWSKERGKVGERERKNSER